jgi:hypothetical protein
MGNIGRIVKVLTHSIQTGQYDRMLLKDDSDYSIEMSRFVDDEALDERPTEVKRGATPNPIESTPQASEKKRSKIPRKKTKGRCLSDEAFDPILSRKELVKGCTRLRR